MGGVSGAFLLLPFQMSFLGYSNPSVSATNHLFNVVAIPSGVYRYWREGRMVWPLMWIIVGGTLPGVFVGAIVRARHLPDPRHFKLFAAAVLLAVGAKMVRDLLTTGSANSARTESDIRIRELIRRRRTAKDTDDGPIGDNTPPVKVTHFNFQRLGYSFYEQKFEVSFWGIFTLSFLVGIVGGIYGMGGGAIIAPFLITVFGLPVYTVAGAALMGTFVTSVAGVVFYQAIAPAFPDQSVAPDWLLGALFGIGGMAGMYLGARCQRFVPTKAIKWMLSGIILATALRYTMSFFGL